MFTLLGYMIMFFVENIMFNSHALLHSVMDGHDHKHGYGSGLVTSQDQDMSACVDTHSHSHHHAVPADVKNSFTSVSDSIGSPDEQERLTSATASFANSASSTPVANSAPLSIVTPISSPSPKPQLSQKSAIVLLLAMSIHRYSYV
jgi:hypothetical protein